MLKTQSLLGVTSTLEMAPTPSQLWDTGIYISFSFLRLPAHQDVTIFNQDEKQISKIQKESRRDRHEGDLLGPCSIS